jgi:4-hydroxy-3-methylbut-2-enyl diphosphate reductase
VFVEKHMVDAQVFRRGFGLRDEIRADVESEYGSRFVDWLRVNNFRCASGRVEIVLAREFGFCYGVERAVDYAYETVRMYPDRRVFLVGEIIHNPGVNQRLVDLGITILPGHDFHDPAYSQLTPEDVVIIPAFGTTNELFARLRGRGCVLVDTTCGSVMNVWKRVRQYSDRGFTSIVHGKARHEETRATCSQAIERKGHFLVVLDREEAETVAAFIRHGGDAGAFLERFNGCHSEGFDPRVHLQHIGLANQTTMLSKESLEVAEILRRAVSDREAGPAREDTFMSFDTICGATQERQDAVVALLDGESPDLMVIVGGYNSSNTIHLVEIAAQRVPTYFIRQAEQILSADEIVHRDVATGADRVERGWMPVGTVRIGVTAGASCPDNQIGRTLLRIFEVSGVAPPVVS